MGINYDCEFGGKMGINYDCEFGGIDCDCKGCIYFEICEDAVDDEDDY